MYPIHMHLTFTGIDELCNFDALPKTSLGILEQFEPYILNHTYCADIIMFISGIIIYGFMGVWEWWK